MEKRFLLFAGEEYYPSGGLGDFVAAYETLEEAEAAASEHPGQWDEIAEFDGQTLKAAERK